MYTALSNNVLQSQIYYYAMLARSVPILIIFTLFTLPNFLSSSLHVSLPLRRTRRSAWLADWLAVTWSVPFTWQLLEGGRCCEIYSHQD